MSPAREPDRREQPVWWGFVAFGAGVASAIAIGRFFNDRNTFSSMDDPTSDAAPISELIRPVVAFIAGVVVVVLLWQLAGYLLNASPRQKAANERARAANAKRARAEAAEREATEARERERRRAEQLAPHIIGDPEWRRIRFRHHMLDVYQATGVRWERRMWSDARTPKERDARAMMNQLRGEDRDLVAAETLRRRNKALTKAEREGGIADWQSAERFVGAWMRKRFANVQLTASGADEGIDVIGAGVVAQVKFESHKVGRPKVQALRGAAGANRALFFAFDMSGYTAPAVTWADENEVALFTFDVDGAIEPANEVAEDFLSRREDEERERREVAERRRTLGRLTHAKAVTVVYDWLKEQIPGGVTLATDTGPRAAVHIWGDRIAATVCHSPTNEVGRPRLERLVDEAGDKNPLVFVCVPKGLGKPAWEFADLQGVAVFGYDSVGRVNSLNQRATAVMAAVRIQRTS